MSFAEDLLHTAMLAQAPIADDLAPLRAALYRRLVSAGWRPSMQPSKGAPHPRRSDEALLAAFLAGDADAFEQLAERHLARLTGYARRHLSHTDADDVIQETMLVLLGRGQAVLQHSTPNVAAFMFGTLRNLLRKRFTARQHEVFDETRAPAEDDDLADLLGEAQERTRLIRLLERTCNVLEQDVLVLVLDGFKNTEIAEKLELKPGHVGKLKHDALKKVRAALKEGAS